MAIHTARTITVHAMLDVFRYELMTLNADGIAREFGERGSQVVLLVRDVGMTILAGEHCMGGGVWLDFVVATHTVLRLVLGSTADRRELESEQDDNRWEENESLQQYEPVLL